MSCLSFHNHFLEEMSLVCRGGTWKWRMSWHHTRRYIRTCRRRQINGRSPSFSRGLQSPPPSCTVHWWQWLPSDGNISNFTISVNMNVFLCSHLSSIFGPTIICYFTTKLCSFPLLLYLSLFVPCGLLSASSRFTMNTPTHCSNLLYNNSVCYIYSVYTEESNWFFHVCSRSKYCLVTVIYNTN
jgi:hypothetical protein